MSWALVVCNYVFVLIVLYINKVLLRNMYAIWNTSSGNVAGSDILI